MKLPKPSQEMAITSVELWKAPQVVLLEDERAAMNGVDSYCKW